MYPIVFGTRFIESKQVIVYANEELSSGEDTVSEPRDDTAVEATPLPARDDNPIENYIHEVFGEDAERGIKMLKECENKSMNPEALNWNGNGTNDFGLWQINSIHGYTHEQLADPNFNTDVAYQIFKSGGESFYFWTCGYIAGDEAFWE